MIKTTTVCSAAGFALLLLFTACSESGGENPPAGEQTAGPISPEAELPPDHPPLSQTQEQLIAPVDPTAGTGASGLAWDVPKNWIAETPANSMRRAQYRVPGPDTDARSAGECVVFYFGPGQGGDAMSNAVRWANQFIQPDGSPSAERLVTEKVEVAGIPVLKAEVTGTYQSGSPMMGGSGELLPDYMLLGAVAEGADANWFFKLTGPRATVEANRAAFESMLESLRPGG